MHFLRCRVTIRIASSFSLARMRSPIQRYSSLALMHVVFSSVPWMAGSNLNLRFFCGFPATSNLPSVSLRMTGGPHQTKPPLAGSDFLLDEFISIRICRFRPTLVKGAWLGYRAMTNFAWNGTIMRRMWAHRFNNFGTSGTSLTWHLPVMETSWKHTRLVRASCFLLKF